jgi:quinoprotein dehydrogenase-associated probable ABC transporter substrate-binding protein
MRRNTRTRGATLTLALALLTAAAEGRAQGTSNGQLAPAAPAAAKGALRVCADPDNLPISNERREGIENKIADLLARDLGDTVAYTWWPQRRGFVRNTLRSRLCDVIIGVPAGFDPVAETQPYYRSTYVVVTRADRNLRIASLDDPKLRGLKIGVNIIGEDYTNTPPAHALGARGIPVVGYSTFYNDENRPEDIINAVARGDIDVAIAWGPLAGYFAPRAPAPLTVVALPDTADSATGFPLAYDMAIGVRRSDRELRARLDSALVRNRVDIQRLLREYNVPLLPAAPRP